MSTVRRIAKNTSILLVAQGISYILAFFYTIYAARYLGPADYGIIAFALAFAIIFGSLADFGIQQVITRDVARDPKQAGQYLAGAGLVRIALSVLAYGLMGLIANILGYSATTITVVYLIGLSVIIGTFTLMLYSIFQAFEHMEFQAAGVIINAVVLFIGIFIAVQHRFDLVDIAWIYVISNAVVLLYSLIVCRYSMRREVGGGFALSYSMVSTGKMLLKESWPLGLAGLLYILRLRLDTILLSIVKGGEAVGIYNASYRFIDIAGVVPSMFVLALFPILAFQYKSSAEKYNMAAEKALKYLLFVALPMGFYTTIYSSYLINLTFGLQYTESIQVLQILIWASVLIYPCTLMGTMLVAAGKQAYIMKISILLLIINAAANSVLIPLFSYTGAAVALIVTGFAELIADAVFLVREGHRLRMFMLLKAPLAGLLVAGLLIGGAFLLRINLLIAGIISAAVYCTIVFKLGIHADDKALINELFSFKNGESDG